jgi:hypothetical protein
LFAFASRAKFGEGRPGNAKPDASPRSCHGPIPATPRSIEDLDTDVVLPSAEIKAVATGNPLIREHAEVAGELARLACSPPTTRRPSAPCPAGSSRCTTTSVG